MKKLIVIYDKEEKDKGRDSYIKVIKKPYQRQKSMTSTSQTTKKIVKRYLS